jgi:ATP-dependent RNA helicase HelY
MAEMSPSQKLAAIKARGKHPIASTFFETFDFDLDDFQIKGCFAIEAGKGVLVAAPTGAGKTIVGEFAAYLAINQR